MVALPFSDLCPPLVAEDAPAGVPAAFAAELEALRAPRRRPARGARGRRACSRTRRPASGSATTCSPSSRTSTRSRAGSRGRRSRAACGGRAAKGCSAEFRTDRPALEDFYRLHVATRRRLGVPTQPRRFILAFEALFAAGLGFVLLVRRGDRPVAAAVFLAFGATLLYKYGASNER